MPDPVIQPYKAGPSPLAFRTCSTAGCGRTILARGLCVKHYTAARRDGALPAKSRVRRMSKQSISLYDEQWAAIHKLSRATGKCDSAIIRDAVDMLIKNQSR